DRRPVAEVRAADLSRVAHVAMARDARRDDHRIPPLGRNSPNGGGLYRADMRERRCGPGPGNGAAPPREVYQWSESGRGLPPCGAAGHTTTTGTTPMAGQRASVRRRECPYRTSATRTQGGGRRTGTGDAGGCSHGRTPEP